MAEIYFDNSATTRVCPEAAQKALEMMTQNYGNPSSLHAMGFRAEQELRECARSRCRAARREAGGNLFHVRRNGEQQHRAVRRGTRAEKAREPHCDDAD